MSAHKSFMLSQASIVRHAPWRTLGGVAGASLKVLSEACLGSEPSKLPGSETAKASPLKKQQDTG